MLTQKHLSTTQMQNEYNFSIEFEIKNRPFDHLFMPFQLELKYGKENFCKIICLLFSIEIKKIEKKIRHLFSTLLFSYKWFKLNHLTLYLIFYAYYRVIVKSFFLIYIQYTSILFIVSFSYLNGEKNKVWMNSSVFGCLVVVVDHYL